MNEVEKLVRSKLIGLITADERGVFNTVNDDMLELFGYSRAEFIGAPLTMIQPHRFRAGHAKGFESYVKTRKSVGLLDRRLEVYGLHKTGYEFPISVRVTVEERGEHLLFKNEIRDITLQREEERGKKFVEPPMFTDLYTLLLVESNYAEQEALIGQLRSHRVANRIVVVSSVQEAEDFVFARSEYKDRPALPYIVILSILLPDASGLVFLRTLRAQMQTKHVPCIITTVLPRTEEMDELIAQGNAAYLHKPVTFDGITGVLSEFDIHWMIGRRSA